MTCKPTRQSCVNAFSAPGSHDVSRDLYARLLRWQCETEDALTLPEI